MGCSSTSAGIASTAILLAAMVFTFSVSCGTSSSFPHSNHVFVVMEENHAFSAVFPNGATGDCASSGMPYLCGLAADGGIATNFYSNIHGSLLAYLISTSGFEWSAAPAFCNGDRCAAPGAVTGNNLVRAIANSGKTWRGYFEDMPEAGYLGGNTANYVDRHNPFKWYSDVADSPVQQSNMVPFSQFADDLNANSFSNFNYVVPNLLHDAHGTGKQSAPQLMSTADAWFRDNIGPLLSTPPFQPGGDGVLIVTFDESSLNKQSGESVNDYSCSPSQTTGCGGHVPFVVVGPMVQPGTIDGGTYHFEDMLHTILSLLGLPNSMNAAGQAANIRVIAGR